MDLAEKLAGVEQALGQALARRRAPLLTGEKVSIVAVTKNHPPQVISAIQALGVADIGENRVQEAKHKAEAIDKEGRWHLIGHLQSNKVKQAVALFDIIESVDSLHLLAAIDKEAAKLGKVQEVLLQLNIAGEEQKSGLDREDYLALLPQLAAFSHVRLRGLMVIAPLAEEAETVRPVFAAAYAAYCRLKEQQPQIDTLSMGMSGDFAVAVEEGANSVRLGTILFGERDYSYKF